MILLTAFLIRMIFILACATSIFVLLRKHCGRKNALLFACCVVLVGGLLAQKISSYVPPLTEVVTITALNEKNPESLAFEVVVTNLTVDGETYPIEITSGKWFWYGDDYMWRPENDVRQPEGITRTIQIEIPVGWERSVNFHAGVYRGMVLVEYADSEIPVDLYAPSSMSLATQIAGSSKLRLIQNQMQYLAAFAAVLLLASGSAALVYRRWLRSGVKPLVWFDNHFWVVYLLISVVSLLYMISLSDKQGFWQDELATINSSIIGREVFSELFVNHEDYYPSIFTGLIYKWYHVAPYGEEWLLLPLELVTAVGVIFTALSAEKIKGRRIGLFAAVFSAFSQNIIYYCGYELRTYGFMYCAAAVILYFYIAKTQNLFAGEPVRKQEIGLGVWIFLAAGCHVFGVFYAGLLFLIDVYLWLTKRIKLRFVIPYIAAAVAFSPWIYNMFCYDVFSMSASFQSQPTFTRVIALLKMLSGGLNLSYYCFLFAVVFVLIYAVRNYSQKCMDVYGPLIPLWLVSGMIGALYLYGTYINTQATMWVDRYFVVLFPAASILMAVAVGELCNLISQKSARDTIAVFLAAQFVLSSYGALNAVVSKERQTFRDAGDWLYAQGNVIYNGNTAVIATTWSDSLNAWKEYYLEEQGRRDPLNVIWMNHIHDDTLDPYKTIYLYYEVRKPLVDLQKILDEEFEMTDHNEKLKIKTYVRKATS